MGLKRFTSFDEWDVEINQGIPGIRNLGFPGTYLITDNQRLFDIPNKLCHMSCGSPAVEDRG
jgi:hypothetical protein